MLTDFSEISFLALLTDSCLLATSSQGLPSVHTHIPGVSSSSDRYRNWIKASPLGPCLTLIIFLKALLSNKVKLGMKTPTYELGEEEET